MMKSEMTTDDWENRDDDDFITISRRVYNSLVDNTIFLQCLRVYGVDNWEGYDEACAKFNGDKDASEQKQGDLFPEEDV